MVNPEADTHPLTAHLGNSPQRETATRHPITILTADDYPAVRQGLRRILANYSDDFELVAEAVDGGTAHELCLLMKPDITIMDLRMKPVDGIEGTKRIKRQMPTHPILMYTTHDDSDLMATAIQAGAAGYVLKESSEEELVDAVYKCLAGEPVLPAHLMVHYLLKVQQAAEQLEAKQQQEALARAGLTARELEALTWVAKGYTNTAIGAHMHLSPHTIKSYVSSVIKKLSASDRTNAAVMAIHLGLLSDLDVK